MDLYKGGSATSVVYIKPDATFYEALHEIAHAQQMADIGVGGFVTPTRAQRESAVYFGMVSSS